ncbi:uncharacterized protein TrAtP1_001595 [Trichoderma atroviride]|uniref:uncharacterized protein n=1 Tax=Hypocrea atroviridis TaxID=63577 RepID=UPI003325CACF|nr:hypothetical protein TrAtP1_001595 [Trichoderma atroviride]
MLIAHSLDEQITTALCLALLLVTPHNIETHLISLGPIVRPGPSLFLTPGKKPLLPLSASPSLLAVRAQTMLHQEVNKQFLAGSSDKMHATLSQGVERVVGFVGSSPSSAQGSAPTYGNKRPCIAVLVG